MRIQLAMQSISSGDTGRYVRLSVLHMIGRNHEKAMDDIADVLKDETDPLVIEMMAALRITDE